MSQLFAQLGFAAPPEAPRQPDLPIELVERIIECLCEDIDIASINPSPLASAAATEARLAGVACALVSRGFARLGRRILYSHLTTEHGLPRFKDFWSRLVSSPHLGVFVTSHTSTFVAPRDHVRLEDIA